MSKFLVKTTEQYRADSEGEAKQLIESAKADSKYTLSKYSSEYKTIKSKGEVVDDYYRVTLVKQFTSEKEPDSTVSVTYDVQQGAFPSVDETEGVEF